MLSKMTKMIKSERGFSLIELAIVLTIGGLIMAAAARTAKIKVVEQQIEDQTDRRAVILNALADYIRDNRVYADYAFTGGDLTQPIDLNGDGDADLFNETLHGAGNEAFTVIDLSATPTIDERFDEVHYPCPADPTRGPEDAGFGTEERVIPPGDDPAFDVGLVCDDTNLQVVGAAPNRIFIGAVPFVELGLPAQAGLDSYKNKFTYAVSESYATSQALAPAAGIGLTSEITIRQYIDHDSNPATPAIADDIPNHAEFVMFSHGQDGQGAFNMMGDLVAPCGSEAANGRDVENCDFDDEIFVDSSVSYSMAQGAMNLDDDLEFSLAVTDNDDDSLWIPAPAGAANEIRDRLGGNVGINTDNPDTRLHVVGDTTLDGVAAISQDANIGGDADIAGNANVLGNLGIGTSAPQGKLEIAGSYDSTNLYLDGGMRIESNMGSQPDIDMNGAGHINSGNSMTLRAGDNMNLEAGSNDDFIFRTMSGNTPTELIRLRSDGRLGIGTNNPAAKLDVTGSLDLTNFALDGGMRIEANMGSLPDVLMFGGGSIAAETNMVFSVDTNGSNHNGEDFSFKKGNLTGSGTTLMTIRNDGRVGIGTVTPSSLLDVAGEIRAGSSGLACNTTTDGSIRKVTAAGVTRMQYCNRTAWVDFQTTAACPAGQAVISISANGTANCGPLPWPNTSCGAGDVIVGVNSDGSAVCKDLNQIIADCPGGQVMRGMLPNGQPRCMDISNTCGSGQVMRGVKTDGTPDCIDPPGNSDCGLASTTSLNLTDSGLVFVKSEFPISILRDEDSTVERTITHGQYFYDEYKVVNKYINYGRRCIREAEVHRCLNGVKTKRRNNSCIVELHTESSGNDNGAGGGG